MWISTNIGSGVARFSLRNKINEALNQLKALALPENEQEMETLIQRTKEEVNAYIEVTQAKADTHHHKGLSNDDYYAYRDNLSAALNEMEKHIRLEERPNHSQLAEAIKKDFAELATRSI